MPPFAAKLRYPSTLEAAPETAPTTAHVASGGAQDGANGASKAAVGGVGGSARVDFSDYIGWMLPCSALSLTGLPCLSLPAGCTRDGRLPIAVRELPSTPPPPSEPSERAEHGRSPACL